MINFYTLSISSINYKYPIAVNTSTIYVKHQIGKMGIQKFNISNQISHMLDGESSKLNTYRKWENLRFLLKRNGRNFISKTKSLKLKVSNLEQSEKHPKLKLFVGEKVKKPFFFPSLVLQLRIVVCTFKRKIRRQRK